MSVSFANESRAGRESAESRDFDESLVSAFERVVLRFPSRTALGSDMWQPTYRELNETANNLAHRLLASGVASGGRVAILMSHDAPMVGAVLGALKAGQIVVALDPDDPMSRLKMLVEDSEPSAIVTDAQNRKLGDEIAGSDCRILTFDPKAAGEPKENPSLKILPAQTAFLTYTSGTTGRPKGVMKTHRQLRRGAAVHTEAMHYTENDRIPLFAMVATGQGATALWFLLNGAMLCPFSLKTKGVTGLSNWIVDRGMSVYASSASIFRTLIKTIDDQLIFANVRAVQLASEAVTADDFQAFRKHFPAASIFVHGLSSSETSNIAWSRWMRDDHVPEGILPVGHFSRDVLLLGNDGQPVARGETGEIVVRSRYVANGYWRNPELTAERFSADLDGQGTRLVRTGDLGRINAGGLLEHRGRKDDRVKIRGNRIELGEIERVLEKLPGVDRAVAVAVRREIDEPVLVAFVVKTPTASWTPQRLRHAVRSNLPLHMLPSRIIFLDTLPYNRGNKIDREALRQYQLPIRGDSKGDEPRTETELLLAEIWADVFDLPGITRDDDFFNLGGDSLKGAVVAAQVHATLGVELNLEAIADHSTMSMLAAFIDECREMGVPKTPPIVRAPRAIAMPMSFNQETTWTYRRGEEGAYVHTNRIIGPLNVDIFRKCLGYLVGRHEILRTTFGLSEGRPAQIIHPAAPLDFRFVDLSESNDPEGQAESIFHRETLRPIDLEKLPIKREVLIKIAHENYRLLRISHAMISDGFSSRMLAAEFATLYEALLDGKEPPLPREARLQYADYAVWQRRALPSNNPVKESVAWWKRVLSLSPPARRLPFKRLIPRRGAEPTDGIVKWQLDQEVSRKLDQIARSAGATHFVTRLAAFAALLADATDNPTVVIGTYLDTRNSVDAQTIAGRFLTTATFVLSYDANKTFVEWTEIVRDRVLETISRNDPATHEQLRASGIEMPIFQFVFMMSSDHSDQHFGGLTMSDEFSNPPTMPQGCTVYVDEQKPDNCRVYFDANRYDFCEMRALLDRYLRLLETVARQPELPMGTVMTIVGAKPLRWKCANYTAPFYELITACYRRSPLLRTLLSPIGTRFSSGE